MAHHDATYLNLLEHVLINGVVKGNRTGINTRSVFGTDMRFDLSDGTIPLLTTKKMHWDSIIHELLWYFSGSTNVKYLQDNGVKIWDLWADANGDLGPLYGKMMRDWNGVDQLANIVKRLKTNPDCRRMVVSYWDPTVLPEEGSNPEDNPVNGKQALAPCHYTWQVYTEPKADGRRKLSLKMTQRSVDMFLGNPFNIAQYSIILHMLCDIVDMDPGDFVWSGGDTHIYSNHIDQVRVQLYNRDRFEFESPTLKFKRKLTSFDDIQFDDFILENYQSDGPLRAPVAK